uniref:Uncharacterized protein n=1 Tax=Anguilla anguilla TaxID=7936 RepID=A0A0E9WLH3_ANGAN
MRLTDLFFIHIVRKLGCTEKGICSISQP